MNKKQSHTPGPLKFYDNRGDSSFDYSPGADGTFNIIDANLKVIAKTKDEGHAARFVACFNACDGIEDVSAVKDAINFLKILALDPSAYIDGGKAAAAAIRAKAEGRAE